MSYPYVYILADSPRNILKVGIIEEEPNPFLEAIEAENCRVVWFEEHESITSAAVRERALKQWETDWKQKLIEELNPEWHDLSPSLVIKQ